jgi:hypothetical protein
LAEAPLQSGSYLTPTGKEVQRIQNNKLRKAAVELQREPLMPLDREYALYLDTVHKNVGRIGTFKAVDDITDPVSRSRGRMAVESDFIHNMLNYVKGADTPEFAAQRRKYLDFLIELGLPADVAESLNRGEMGKAAMQENARLYFPSEGGLTQEQALKLNNEKAIRFADDIARIYRSFETTGRTGVLVHPDNAPFLRWALEHITGIDRSLKDGTRASFNPGAEQGFVSKKFDGKWSDIPEDLRTRLLAAAKKINMTDDTGHPMRKGIKIGEATITPADLISYIDRAQRRYALDIAGLIDPKWVEVDAKGLDVPAFENKNHPTGDSAASIGYTVTTDATAEISATSDQPRDMTAEIKATKALKKYLAEKIGETVDIMQGSLSKFTHRAEEPLSMSRPYDSNNYDNIRLNRTDPYTTDHNSVRAKALQIQRELATERLVMIHVGDGEAIKSGPIKLRDGTTFAYRDDYVIFPEGDPRIKETLSYLGPDATVTEPFLIGEPVKFPAGAVSPDHIQQFKFGVDPVVFPAVKHGPLPLRDPYGVPSDVAYVPASMTDGFETKPVHEFNVDSSRLTPDTTKVITHVVADSAGQYPTLGEYYDGYVFGNSYNDIEMHPSEVKGGGPLSLSRLERAEAEMLVKEREMLTEQGAMPEDFPALTPKQEELIGKYKEETGVREKPKPGLTFGEEGALVPLDTKETKPYDAETIFAEHEADVKTNAWKRAQQVVANAVDPYQPGVVTVSQEVTPPLDMQPAEQAKFNELARKLMFIVRHRAIKSAFFAIPNDPRASTNREISAIEATSARLLKFKNLLEIHGLQAAEIDAVIRDRVIPKLGAYSPGKEFWYQTQRSYYPTPIVDPTGYYGIQNRYLPAIKTENPEVGLVADQVYRIMLDHDRILSGSDAGSGISLDEAMYKAESGQRTQEELKYQMPEGEATLPNFGRNAGKALEEAKAKLETARTTEELYAANAEVKRLTAVVNGEIPVEAPSTRKIEVIAPRPNNSIGRALATLKTPEDVRAAIELAYSQYSRTHAQSISSSSILKSMNALLEHENIKATLANTVKQWGSFDINTQSEDSIFIDKQTGEKFLPETRGSGQREVSVQEFMDLMKRAGHDIGNEEAAILSMVRDSGYKIVFDQNGSGRMYVTTADVDKMGKIVVASDETIPQRTGTYMTAEQAQAAIDQAGNGNAFEVVPLEPGQRQVGFANENQQFIIRLRDSVASEMPLDAELSGSSDSKLFSKYVKLISDVSTRASFLQRVKVLAEAQGVAFPYTPEEITTKHIFEIAKPLLTGSTFPVQDGMSSIIGPFHAGKIGAGRSRLAQERLVKMPMSKAPMVEALAGMESAAATADPAFDPQMEFSLKNNPKVAAAIRKEAGGFRPKGSRRVLTPSEKALSAQIRFNLQQTETGAKTGFAPAEGSIMGGGMKGAHIAGGAAAGMGLMALIRHIQSGSEGDKETMAMLPTDVAMNAAFAVNPLLGSAVSLGHAAMNHQDMLRSIFGLVGSLGGGALGGAAGLAAGGVGAFAGGMGGSMVGGMAGDALYTSIFGNGEKKMYSPNLAEDQKASDFGRL